MLPDWAPNLHPLIVHFPIALLITAVLVDLAGLIWRTSQGLHLSATLLYCAGALGALAAYLTGNQAADTVFVPTEAISTLNTHQDLALYTLIFFGIYAAGRVALFVLTRVPKTMLRVSVVVVGLAGQWLIWQTSDHGGQLVFEHGVGVGAVERMTEELQELRREQFVAQAAPSETEGGGFVWVIGPGAEEALGEAFDFVEGSAGNLDVAVEEEDGRYALTIVVRQSPVLFVGGGHLASVDAEAEIDVSQFTGSVALVHNVQGPQAYHYLRLAEESVLGRVVDGSDQRLDGGRAEFSGWATIRTTGDQGHFYGYVDGTTVAHGHSPAPAAGPVGLRIEGTGTVRLRRLEARWVP